MLFGCAETPVAPKKLKQENQIQADWQKLDPRFGSLESDGKISINPFFDIDWKMENITDKDPKNLRLPFFVTTAQESSFLYDFDLYSGKLYQERTFCEQDDIWGNYTDNIFKPNFTLGIIPRTYDERKKPQQVMVFAKDEHVPPFKEYPTNYSDIRLVGSVIVEHCENYPCTTKDRWKTSQILVGVPPKDPAYANVETFLSLKKKVDWNYAKAMLTNMHGHHNVGGKFIPAYRILKDLGPIDTLEYMQKNSVIWNPENITELKAWRTGCFKLYDSLWEEAETIRKKPNNQAEAFFKYFKEFYSKNTNEFYECLKLVRPASILENPRRVWFFSYIQAFVLLEKNGFSYSCRENTWSTMFKMDFDRCKAQNFENIFSQSINGLRLMKDNNNKLYRFIEYDNALGGSHQSIYNWIYDRPQNYACKDKKAASQKTNQDIFPHDVEWESFKQDDERLLR
jgi:hypothetical protein